ncbi:carboxypeptidase-like regulatory domain-containing protein [Sphingobacterium sp. E70]|uniref:STN domain-containing protein n=1 Tax=Sphingobacterium sp. E70 TaxID=2853439 RepID=UPI00211C7A38|nr:STN domain-containing protein [Sphingobacterium sp. E70]ULT22365.1 carboxypeptidase-like regulatory domain-containing protein [Sphingobacterium sp. E70]
MPSFRLCDRSQANGVAQKVTLKMKNARIEEALNAISKQSNLQLFYGENIDSKARVNVNLKDASVEEALNSVLRNNHIDYKIIANTISVNGKTDGARSSNIVQQGVSGTVKDKNGNALAGATVTVKGTAITTQTASDGSFRINAGAEATLVVRYVGYGAVEVGVKGRNVVPIVLASDERQIEEVVVTGMGQRLDKRLFTGRPHRFRGSGANRRTD